MRSNHWSHGAWVLALTFVLSFSLEAWGAEPVLIKVRNAREWNSLKTNLTTTASKMQFLEGLITSLSLPDGVSTQVDANYTTALFFFESGDRTHGVSHRALGGLVGLLVGTKETTREIDLVKELAESGQNGGIFSCGPPALATYKGICGLLSVAHSVIDTLGCKLKAGQTRNPQRPELFSDDFIRRLAEGAGPSTSGGSTELMETALYESDLWDCGKDEIRCGASFPLLTDRSNNPNFWFEDVKKRKEDGEDCSLALYKCVWVEDGEKLKKRCESGHVMHIKRIEKDNYGRYLFRTTHTGVQGDTKRCFADVPANPGEQLWELNPGPDFLDPPDIDILPQNSPGGGRNASWRFWKSLGYNDAEYSCCRRRPKSVEPELDVPDAPEAPRAP